VRIHATFAFALAVGGSSLAIAAASAANGAGKSSLTLSRALPSIVRQGSEVTVSGKVRHSPRHGKAILESMRSGSWVMLASSKIGKHGAFKISWRVPATEQIGPLSLRVEAVNRERVIVATTRAAQSAVGPASELCSAPVPPAVNIPVGDGWIVGGRYNEGGAYPGIYACDSQQYTVTATDSAGKVQATQTVAGGHSYTLVVPAGSYTLTSDFCHGTATVTAAKQTRADTVCPVP
jgi:hypothetical protein